MTGVPKRFGYECPPDHRHALSNTCYNNHKCCCTDCREHIRVYQANKNRKIAYGTWDSGYVDTAPTRAHILYLRTQGIGWKRLAVLSGVPAASVENVLYGSRAKGKPYHHVPAKRMLRRNAERILAVSPDANRRMYPVLGASRRVRGLMVMGYSLAAQARRIGASNAAMQSISAGNHQWVTHDTFKRICAMYEELRFTQATADDAYHRAGISRTRVLAKTRGYAAPIEWENIDTDDAPAPIGDVDVTVDEVFVENTLNGVTPHRELTHAERLLGVELGHRRQYSDVMIAHRLHYPDRSVFRDRKRLGLPGLGKDSIEYTKERQIA